MEYIINSKKYGRKVVLLDEEDYKAVINENYSLSLTYDKTIKNFDKAVECRLEAERKYFPSKGVI